MAQEKFLVIKGDNGMGNRLLALAKGLVYAKISGRQIIVDWRDGIYAKKGINAFDCLFSSPAIINGQKMPESDSIFPKEWKGNMEKNIYEIIRTNFNVFWILCNGIKNERLKYFTDLSKIDYKEDVLVMFDISFNFHQLEKIVHLLPEEWPKSERELLRYIFKNLIFLNGDIKSAVDAFKSKHFKNKVIGVHIRHTDNIFTQIDGKEYYKAIDSVLNFYPDATIFVATDNRNVLDRFQKKYANVISAEKFYPEEKGRPIHYYAKCKDKINMAKEALVDMYLLSLCDYLVVTDKSSFSFIAVTVSSIEKDRIFVLKNNSRFAILLARVKYTCANFAEYYFYFLSVVGVHAHKNFPGLYRILKKYFPDY